MAYRVKISGLQYESEVEGAQDWTRTVTRDFNDRLFRTRGDYRFTGHDGLFNLLYNHLAVKGVCEPLEARIYFDTGTDWDYEWRGEIKPQDFEFDMVRRNADGQILDASWAARFNNVEDQKVFLRSTRTINDNSIAPCNYTACQFFDPTDATLGNYLADTRICFRVYEVFKFLVSYYTDNTVTFESDYFNTGNGFQYWITTGQEIREFTGWVNPEVSFSEVFTEMNKKCNLWIIIEGTQAAPIIRIEPFSYVFDNFKLLEIRDPEEIKISTDLDQLYTVIKVGSTATEFDIDNDANYLSPRFFAWDNEEYNTQGGCQFENNSLDLVSTWKIDTNTIEKILNGGSEDFDEDIFLIEIDGSPDYDAFKFTTDLTGPDGVEYIYNYNLTNEQVLLEWFDGIPQSVIKSLTENYYAYVDTPTAQTTTVAQVYSDPIAYQNDSAAPATDPDDLYTTAAEASGDDTEAEFKIPQDGYYDFYTSTTVSNPSISKFLTITAHIWTNNTRARRRAIVNEAPNGREFVTASSVLIHTFRLYCLANEVVTFHVYDASAQTGNGGYDITLGTATMQNVEQSYTAATDDPLIHLYNIGLHDLPRADFDTLDQGLGFVRIVDTNGEKYFDVYAKEATYNSTTGILEGEFIGTRPPTELCWILQDGTWDDDCYWLDSKVWID